MTVEKNVPYGDTGCVIDLHIGSASHRILIWLHGGGLEGGTPDSYAHMAAPLARIGTDLALPSYRFLQEAPWPACAQDAAASVAYVASRFPGREIWVGGSSAGAYLSMLLCLDERYLAAHGMKPSDIRGWLFNSGQPTTHFNVLKYRRMDSRLCRLDEAAPLYYVHDAGPDAPMLILCAENDMTCRVAQNHLLRETLEHFGRSPENTETEILPGYTHCQYDFPDSEHPESLLAHRLCDFIARRA